MKKTVVIGASAKTDRYSNRAVRMLHKYGHDVIALGFEHAIIDNTTIETDWKVSLKPKRVIFNPGTENAELEQLCFDNNIQPIEACTLVMLSTGQF